MAGAPNLILAISWLPLIYAQSSGQSSRTETPSTTSSSAASAVHTVDVGEDGLTFDPDTLSVSPRSKVEFHFYLGNHSVAQAAFSKPCHPLNQSSLFSGFIPATDGESPEVFTLTVNDTSPIWYYCGQVGHCQAGMAGVVNPPRNGPDTLDAFKSAAKDAGDTTVPAAAGGGTLGKPSNAFTTSSGISQTITSTGSSTSIGATTSLSLSSSSRSTSTATSTSRSSPSPTSEGSCFVEHSVGVLLDRNALSGTDRVCRDTCEPIQVEPDLSLSQILRLIDNKAAPREFEEFIITIPVCLRRAHAAGTVIVG